MNFNRKSNVNYIKKYAVKSNRFIAGTIFGQFIVFKLFKNTTYNGMYLKVT